jgi:putative ABC transport system ATP-binding protein
MNIKPRQSMAKTTLFDMRADQIVGRDFERCEAAAPERRGPGSPLRAACAENGGYQETAEQCAAGDFPQNAPAEPVRSSVLKAEHLTKQVQSPEGLLTIVHDVSLDIASGESIAVVGPSGAGKSTLLALLAGLDLPTGGRVLLEGRDLTQLDEDGRALVRARRVGFVFQSFHLLPSLTALENVMLPLELARHPQAREAALETLRQVGLRDRARHYPRQLSGGEQQRVALARAFVTQPAVLFADEPTGNLDAATGARIGQLLFEMNARSRTTLVLVTHDDDLATRCERIVHMEAGGLG